ncbi:hypothetical protein BBJ29_005778 [Phytophthora kernoviae]|uniref:Protein kinase domain-containing protein n=1 Tax=Phytophthora kernoviae TaxID=325452 RepID=A0A3R7GN23_9STRA|nr:hypothetical protein BBJ29_005778 [Phytophthora kernoviae]
MSSTPPLSSLGPPHVFRSVSDTSSVRGVSSNGATSFNPVASGSAGEQFHPPMSFLRRVVSATSPTHSKDATDREKTKELEKKELLAMILESIANVPVAVERIHTNEKLRTALKEEMGAENTLLHRFFDTKQQKQDQHETLKLQQNLSADNLQRWERNRRAVNEEEDEEEEDGQEQSATSLDVYEHYQHSQEEDADSKGSDSEGESDSSSSGFGSEYENDLAEAVNQLCMTDDALTAMDDMISDPISIVNATLGNAGSARVSISPQSSFGLGASPGTASMDDDSHDDGEPKEYEEFQLRIIREKNRTGFEPNQDWRPRAGNVIGGRYKVEMTIGEAVFSRTYKGTDTSTDQAVCLKIIKNNKEYFDQGVDEIRVLDYIDQNCKVDERHLVRLLDYFYFREHLIIVTELLRDNLYEFSRLLLQRGVINYFSIPRLKKITIEVLEALDTLHALGLVHCDLKPENILIQNFSSCTIKVIDFGSACFVTDELTSYVQSRSYRAPEVILGLLYDQKIDLWSLGCVIAEMFTGEVLFRNDSEQTLLARIMTTIGPIPASLLVAREELQSQLIDTGLFTVDQAGNGVLAARLHLPPLEEAVPTKDLEFLEFLRALLQIDPTHRLSARQALAHPWLQHGVFSENRM